VDHDIPDTFIEFAENVSAISQVITFFIFGALIVATGYHGEIWRLAIFVILALLVARPVAILLSLIRSRLPARRRRSSPGSGRRASHRCFSPSSS
jgi:NhaP-type Na+/H+ or K+/H+ antiporter